MKQTILICDVCRQQKESNQVAELKPSLVLPASFSFNNYSRSLYPKGEFHICKECLQKKKMFIESKDGSKTTFQSEESVIERFKDVLVELLEDVGVLFEE